jgi:hypothetical protein
MIISHSRRFVFIKTRKTAGTSLEIALARHCGDADVITPLDEDDEARRRSLGIRGAQNFRKRFGEMDRNERVKALLTRERPPKYAEHIAASQVRDLLGATIWADYFSFTVVRNPFDRCVSRYFWTQKSRFTRKVNFTSFDEFMRNKPEAINENWLLYAENERPLVDFCVRYERMAEDLAEVSRRIGLGHNLADDLRGIRAKSGFRPENSRAADLLGESQIRVIAELCRPEIELFGYRIPVPRTAPPARAPVRPGPPPLQ